LEESLRQGDEGNFETYPLVDYENDNHKGLEEKANEWKGKKKEKEGGGLSRPAESFKGKLTLKTKKKN